MQSPTSADHPLRAGLYAAFDELLVGVYKFSASIYAEDLLILLLILLILLLAAPGAPGSTLLHRPKGALLGLVARLEQTLNGLLAERMLLAAHNAPRLRLHQIRLLQAAARTLRRSVKNLCLGADGNFCHGSTRLFDLFLKMINHL